MIYMLRVTLLGTYSLSSWLAIVPNRPINLVGVRIIYSKMVVVLI